MKMKMKIKTPNIHKAMWAFFYFHFHFDFYFHFLENEENLTALGLGGARRGKDIKKNPANSITGFMKKNED